MSIVLASCFSFEVLLHLGINITYGIAAREITVQYECLWATIVYISGDLQ